MNAKEITEKKQKSSFGKILRKAWPCFVSYGTRAFSVSVLYINIYVISTLIWPFDSFRSFEIGLLIGLSTYMMAFSGILFGNLADRYSRIWLFAISTGFYGLGLFLNGFSPQGLGLTTYIFFIICQVIRGFFSGGLWPTINSYANDATTDDERSRFFGALTATWQIFQLIGMFLVALSFQTGLWRLYFILTGLSTIVMSLILLRGREYKRASTHDELKHVLADENIQYEYQLNRETIKKTIFAPTNLVAFFEGIFTTIVISIPDFLLVAYFQSPPHNYSQVSTSIFMIIFGIPAGIFGAVVFGKLSDHLAGKNIKNRIYMIIFSIITTYILFTSVFFLPLPHLSPEAGNNFLNLFSYPMIWVMGIIAFIVRSVLGLYNINQSPILQKINLPEAQGIISSSNQFLELIGSGTGPVMAGGLLMVLNGNYQSTVFITMSLGVIGALLWFATIFFIDKDINRISSILKERGVELLAQKKLASLPNEERD
ncbi:MAG: MFS transporter [Promethearchaeota archaeon]|nr:MAG: MFS transporter [Candidatus Lokiarchaeota archaeon]